MGLGDDQLPETYVLALRLRRDGMDAPGIARRMGIEPEAVPALLVLAEAKLERVRREAPTDEG